MDALAMRAEVSSGALVTAAMLIRAATPADLDRLVPVARASFFDAYCEIDDHAVIREYCALHFTHERFDRILGDAASCLLVVETGTGELAGFAHVVVSDPPSCVAGPSPVELARIYLAKEWIGRGIGAALMREAIREARRRGGQTLWLGVYERNTRAMAFYARFGLHVVGTKPFDWGGEIYDDPIMAGPI